MIITLTQNSIAKSVNLAAYHVFTLMQEVFKPTYRNEREPRKLYLQFYISAISETRAELDIIIDLDLINCNAYYIARENRNGGGVAIYARKELSR